MQKSRLKILHCQLHSCFILFRTLCTSNLNALLRLKLGPELTQLFVGLRIVLEEGVLILRIDVEVLLELRVRVKSLIGWEPQEVLILGGQLVVFEVTVVEGQPVPSSRPHRQPFQHLSGHPSVLSNRTWCTSMPPAHHSRKGRRHCAP